MILLFPTLAGVATNPFASQAFLPCMLSKAPTDTGTPWTGVTQKRAVPQGPRQCCRTPVSPYRCQYAFRAPLPAMCTPCKEGLYWKRIINKNKASRSRNKVSGFDLCN